MDVFAMFGLKKYFLGIKIMILQEVGHEDMIKCNTG
jgi:hypothetical protein